MKKLFLTLAAIGALTFTSAAQGNGRAANGSQKENMTPEQKSEKETKKVTEKLGLSTDQQAKFKVYSLEKNRTNKNLREKAKATTNKEEKQKYHAEMKANNEKFFVNVNSILNANQKTKWEEHKKKMQERQAKNQAED